MAFGELLLVQNRLSLVQIDQHQIGIKAFTNRALVPDVPDASRGFAHPRHDFTQQTAAMSDFVQHQSERVFHGRKTGRRLWIQLTFFLQRMRRMIGGDDFEDAFMQALPDRGVVGFGLDRRVHLDQ